MLWESHPESCFALVLDINPPFPPLKVTQFGSLLVVGMVDLWWLEPVDTQKSHVTAHSAESAGDSKVHPGSHTLTIGQGCGGD